MIQKDIGYVCVCVRVCSFAQLPQPFVIPWTVALQAPLSMGFSRQEYRNGLPCLLLGIFPTRGLNPHLPCLLHCRQTL